MTNDKCSERQIYFSEFYGMYQRKNIFNDDMPQIEYSIVKLGYQLCVCGMNNY